MRRERNRTGRAARSKAEQEAVLLRIHAYGKSRVASEAADERQAHLQRLLTKKLERLATEPTDDRRALLQRLCTCMRRLIRMALPQARPTMLCIH